MKNLLETLGHLKKKHIDFAVIKLSLFYVLILMTISIAFSISFYNISTNEIGRGLGRQSRAIGMMGSDPIFDQIEQIRNDQMQESQNHITLNLIYFNLLILLISSLSSYFFAKKTLEPIEKAMEEQNRFTADASHELRTPLTAMKTEIEVALRDRKLNFAESKKLLESNLEEIEKLESLSNALLKLAKNDSSKLTLDTINLEETIIAAYERIESLADSKSIEFENKLFAVELKGDYSSLVELFVILLDNAVKYSPSNSKVEIQMERQDNILTTKIKDRGVGVKASDLPYIFNRFYRADSSRNKEKISGYGLGLSIAKQIVDLHNGSITATSKAGQGSEFIVKLPLIHE